MNFNSSGYFAYKKNKIQREIEEQKKPISRLSFLCQLFFVTFVVIFIVIVVSIMKYSAKVDIEYTKGELQLNTDNITSIPNYNNVIEEEPQQRTIDKRLMLIQQEENAPSKAKVVEKTKDNLEVISVEHIEKNKKIDKLERLKLKEDKVGKTSIVTTADESKQEKKFKIEDITLDKNITIMSKVLVGRFTTFEEAQKLQHKIKAQTPSLQPFVKKIGNVFAVQMGSYQDFNVAKSHAQKLQSLGYDVWIYQQ